MTYRVSGRARRDPIEIWRYIDLITQRFRLVDENPYAKKSGRASPRLSQLSRGAVRSVLSSVGIPRSNHACAARKTRHRGLV